MHEINTKLTDTVRIAWTVGDVCNYSCSYCRLNLNKKMPPDAETIKDICEVFIDHYEPLGKTVEIQFTGGEPTVIPNFQSVLRMLHNRNCKTSLLTNGSPNLDWWEQNANTLNTVNISVHLDFVDIEELEEKIDLLKDRDLHLTIATTPENFETATELKTRWDEEFQEHEIQITYQLLYKDMPFNQVLMDYTPEQLQIAYGTTENNLPTSDTNENEHVDKIRSEKRNTYKGYICYAGLDTLVIDYAGHIRRSHCGQGQPICNISDPNILENLANRLPALPMLCEQDRCPNWFDMTAYKQRP
ncbi:radical SAM protein [Candidatus Woesearchaeota archaeon]|jgi:organic radical activating enzyme|nr:radical SAM protein [Candidatus Woesearchaeota archaeon]